jgi:hypothetical protein
MVPTLIEELGLTVVALVIGRSRRRRKSQESGAQLAIERPEHQRGRGSSSDDHESLA